MQCTKCGAQLPDNARFCHVCGQAQTADAGQPAREPQGAAPAPQPAPPAAQVQAPVQTITAAAQAVQGAAAVAGAAKKGLSGAKIFLIVVVLAALCGGCLVLMKDLGSAAVFFITFLIISQLIK